MISCWGRRPLRADRFRRPIAAATASLLPGGMGGCPTPSPESLFHPGRRQLVRPPLPGRADAAAVGGLAAHRRGERRPGGLAHRLGQDAHRVPGRHRCRLPRRRGGIAARGTPEVLYISPLRALAVDVHENLHVPLTEIREEAARLGYPDPGLRVAIRTGDTPAAERAAMKKQSPDLLVTTPESLYLLLTAPSSRRPPARRAHGDRRRGAHAGPRQAGQPPGAVPGAVGRAGARERRSAPAHRPLGHPAAARRWWRGCSRACTTTARRP